MKYEVSYYTLSDGQRTVTIETKNGDAVEIAARNDDFDRLISIVIIKPVKMVTIDPGDEWPL